MALYSKFQGCHSCWATIDKPGPLINSDTDTVFGIILRVTIATEIKKYFFRMNHEMCLQARITFTLT